jgi:hypothetical protein
MTGHQALEETERSTGIRRPSDFGSAGVLCNKLHQPSIDDLSHSIHVCEVRHCHAEEAGQEVLDSAYLASLCDLLRTNNHFIAGTAESPFRMGSD